MAPLTLQTKLIWRMEGMLSSLHLWIQNKRVSLQMRDIERFDAMHPGHTESYW